MVPLIFEMLATVVKPVLECSLLVDDKKSKQKYRLVHLLACSPMLAKTICYP